MSQNIADRSRQHASSSRNRKAAIVQEVRQEESEKLTTRVVTNYNHMHALTIQYFEVVQAVAVKTRVKRIQPCLYLPVAPIEDWTPELISRFRAALLRSALDIAFAETLILSPDRLFVGFPGVYALPQTEVQALIANTAFQNLLEAARDATGTTVAQVPVADWELDTDWKVVSLEIAPASLVWLRALDFKIETTLANHRKVENEALFGKALKEVRSIELSIVPQVSSGAADGGTAGGGGAGGSGRDIRVASPFSRYTDLFDLAAPGVSLADTSRLRRAGAADDGDDGDTDAGAADEGPAYQVAPIFRLTLKRGDDTISLPGFAVFTDPLDPSASADGRIRVPLYRVGHTRSREYQLQHLRENARHYTQAIYKRMTALDYSTALSRYDYMGSPLLDIVDPKPIAMSGPYVIFRLDKTDAAAEDWLKTLGDRKAATSDIIPVATGGIFAEAVQGRANSAERLDLTRFWNWQDSPIPIVAPEIAPLQAGSRAQSADVRPGALGQPSTRQADPTSLPDPDGIASLAGFSAFRDMSGIIQTAALAQAALEEAQKGATNAGVQAKESLAKGLDLTRELSGKIIDLNKEMAKFAVDKSVGAISGAFGEGGWGSGIATAFGNISNAGATLNYDRQRAKETGGAGGSGGGGASGSSVGTSGGGSAGDSADPDPASGGAFNRFIDRPGVNYHRGEAFDAYVGNRPGVTDTPFTLDATRRPAPQLPRGLAGLLKDISLTLRAERASPELFRFGAGLEPIRDLHFHDDWAYAFGRDDGVFSISNLKRKARHGGHDMLMTVFEDFLWQAPKVADPAIAGGAEITLPLAPAYRSAVGAGGEAQILASDSHAYHRIPLTLDSSCFAVYAHAIEPSGEVKSLAAGDVAAADFTDRALTPALSGISPQASVLLTLVELALCAPAEDFDPFGGVTATRIFPVASVWSNRPLAALQCTLEFRRPEFSPMSNPVDNGRIGTSFYTDRNFDHEVGLFEVMDWTGVFDHYRLDGAGSAPFEAVGRKVERSLDGHRRLLGHDPVQHEIDTTVRKLARQGAFDNVHLAPLMYYQPVLGQLEPAYMAPVCHHDCLHLHWRWGSGFPQKQLRGWSEYGPHTKIGAPMVPPGQVVEVSPFPAATPGIRYRAECVYAPDSDEPAHRWEPFFHHGAAYALSLSPTAALGLELSSGGDLNSFYYFMRHDQRSDPASPGVHATRINESLFGPLEAL